MTINPTSKSPIVTMKDRRARVMMARASGDISASAGEGSDMQVSSGEEVEHGVVVTPETAGGRLDAVLAQALGQMSRSRIKQLILGGAVSIDGATIVEPNYRVKLDEELVLVAPELVDALPQPE